MRHKNQPQFDIAYAEESAVERSQALIEWAMDEAGVSQKELADRLGVSEAAVSQMLGLSPKNLSVKRLARVLHALNDKLTISTANRDAWLKANSQSINTWSDVFAGMRPSYSRKYETHAVANDCDNPCEIRFIREFGENYLKAA